MTERSMISLAFEVGLPIIKWVRNLVCLETMSVFITPRCDIFLKVITFFTKLVIDNFSHRVLNSYNV